MADDRLRFIVEDVHGIILSRDLALLEPRIMRMLSGPCTIEGKLHPFEPTVRGLTFKPWGNWIHAEKMVDGVPKIIASGIVQPGDVDPESGILSLKAIGFSNYPKGLYWLENWNPIAVDPFEIFERIWHHIQNFDTGDLGVTVYPTSSGTLMLPGFSFDLEELILDFFAIFIREIDFNDCGEYLEKLARDIPIDYFERSEWDATKSHIIKKIELAYPHGGWDQTEVTAFNINENVLRMTPKQESEINWISDIIIRGWFPGKVYSYTLANSDPDRYRRVLKEEDVHINSNERAQAWCHRKLARRQIPHYFESITIDINHPNAPFGTWDVGDTIKVKGPMPWVGEISQNHRITSYTLDDENGLCELQLMAEGAFNYDPIYYPGSD